MIALRRRRRGSYLRPALVPDPAEDLRVVTDEQFGPALPFLAYDGLADFTETHVVTAPA